MPNRTIQEEANEVIDYLVYMNLMASFVPWVDFEKMKEIVLPINDFIRKADENELRDKLPGTKAVLGQMTEPLIQQFPLKRDLRLIASEFNSFFQSGREVYSSGLDYGC